MAVQSHPMSRHHETLTIMRPLVSFGVIRNPIGPGRSEPNLPEFATAAARELRATIINRLVASKLLLQTAGRTDCGMRC